LRVDPPRAMVPAKAKGDPEDHEAFTFEIVTPSSPSAPLTDTLKVPDVVAEPVIDSPEPLGPAVDDSAMLAAELAYEKVKDVCAVHPLGSGNPKRPAVEKEPWKDTDEEDPLPVPDDWKGIVTGDVELSVCDPPGHDDGVVTDAALIVKPDALTDPPPIVAVYEP